jgi:hypothetical protein
MPRALWADVIRDSFGNPVAGARVEVRDAGGSGPTGTALYASWAGAAQLANPLTANAQGFVWFYTAAPGTFDLWVTAAGYSPRLVAGVQTGVSGALDPGLVPVMGPSGAGHGAGLVPDPGAVAGSARYLREDASWAGLLETTAQGAGTVLAGPASGGPGLPGFRALGVGDLPGVGGVPAARVVQQAGQALGANGWTTVNWDTVEYGLAGMVDLGADTVTVPRAGVYGVSGGALVTGVGAGERVVVSVWRDGGEALRLYDGRAGGAGDVGAYGSGLLRVGAGAVLALRVYLGAAVGRMTYGGGAYTWWSVVLLWRE